MSLTYNVFEMTVTCRTKRWLREGREGSGSGEEGRDGGVLLARETFRRFTDPCQGPGWDAAQEPVNTTALDQAWESAMLSK